MDKLKHANALSSQTKTIMQREIRLLEAYKQKVETEDAFSKDNKEQFKIVKAAFTTNVNALGNKQKKESKYMDNAFDFLESAWNDGQEMTLFVTELTVNKNIASFIACYGCDSYHKHNKSMLIYDEDKKLENEIDELLDDADMLKKAV